MLFDKLKHEKWSSVKCMQLLDYQCIESRSGPESQFQKKKD